MVVKMPWCIQKAFRFRRFIEDTLSLVELMLLLIVDLA